MGSRKRIAAITLSLALVPVACVGISRPMIHLCERRYVQPLAGEIPDHFPVLVCWPQRGGAWNARILYYRDLADFRKRTVGVTFQIPEGQEAQVRATLAAHCRARTGKATDPWIADFRVEPGPAGALLRVEGSFEDKYVNVGWYTAGAYAIRPVRHMFYYGPALLMAVFPLAFLMALALWVGGYVVVERLTGAAPADPAPAAHVRDDSDLLRRLKGCLI